MKIVKNTSYLVIGNLVAQIIPLLSLIVFSRMYSIGDFGVFAKFIAASMILSSITVGQYQHTIIIEKTDKEALKYYYYCHVINIILTLLLGSLLIFIDFYFHFKALHFGYLNIPGLYLVIIYGFLISSIQIMTFMLNRLGKYKVISISKIISGIAIALATYYFGITNIAEGLILGSLLGVLLQYGYLLSKTRIPKFRFTFSNIKSFMFKFANLPKYTLPHSFLDMLVKNLLVFIIGGYYGEKILGLYSIAEKIIRIPVSIIASAFSEVFRRESSIIYYKKGAEELKVKIVQYVTYGLFLITIPTIIIAINSETLFSLFLGQKWELSGTYFKYISPLMIVYFISSWLSVIPILIQKQALFFKRIIVLNIVLYIPIFYLAKTGYNIHTFLLIKTLIETIGLGYISLWIISSIEPLNNEVK